jgi:hypothetical protein
MDDIFSFSRSSREEITEEKLTEYEEEIDILMEMWEKFGLSMTTVKRHCVQDHLIEQLRLYGELKEYFEDFVELMHQNQKKKSKRGKIRDFEKMAQYYNAQEYLGMNQKVQQARKLIAAKAKRRFKDLRRP